MEEILLILDLIVDLMSIKIPQIIHIAISLLFIKVDNTYYFSYLVFKIN